MEEVKEFIQKFKASLIEEKHQNKTSKKVQEFITNLESDIETICRDTSEDKKEENELELLFFLEVLKDLVNNEKILKGINKRKIQMTLSAAQPDCACPPEKKPCRAEKTTKEFINSFVELLN